jgi:hypothetical protein
VSSLVLYANEFDGQLNNGLAPESFKYRILAEGDSWMDRSAMFHTSLLQKLAPKMDAAGDAVLIINLSRFGDTLRRMGQCADGEFRLWINHAFAWKFDAVLLSAGGNDFIDAARDPDAGCGILKNFAGAPPPALGRDCLDRAGVATLVDAYLAPSFAAFYAEVQASRHAGVPIFLNLYDTPVARDAPAFPGGRSWLHEAYVKNAIPPQLWPDLTRGIFADVEAAISGWTVGRSGLHCVPTGGTLVAADPHATASSGDWLNEIHPNAAGWEKLAAVWQKAIKQVLP